MQPISRSKTPRALDPKSLRTALLVAATATLGVVVGVAGMPDAPKASADDGATSLPAAVGSAGADLTPLWVGLSILVAAAVFLIAVSRRARAIRGGSGAIHVVDTQHLGGRRMVHLLRVDGRKYLIGNSERGIHFLASIPQNELEQEIDELDGGASEAEGETAFSTYLTLSGRAR